jgi:hydroxypyruvate isomerase
MPTRGEAPPRDLSRRQLLKQAATVAAAGVVAAGAPSCAIKGKVDVAPPGKVITKGRIHQSIVQWCFADHWDLDELCGVARKLGCTSIELVEPKDWPTLQKHGLTCAIAPNGMPGAPFVKGFNNPKHHDELLTVTQKTIDQCAEFGVKTVIAFTGMKWRNAEDPSSGAIPAEEGAENCVLGLKKLCAYAEKKNVNVAIEILNSRVSSHPMKGHPGYQGDHTDYVVDIIRRVGSPNMKILFDIYHVQIMDGDVITRIRDYATYIGHVHTAGNPGRRELDRTQEINFPPIMEALVDVGYKGYVGHEFIPTGDPYDGLVQAVTLCDV